MIGDDEMVKRYSGWKKIIKYGLTWVIIVFAIFFFVFPIYWAVSTSFKAPKEAFSEKPVWIFQPTLENYKIVLLEKNFSKFLINSVITTAFSTVLTLILGGSVAYAVSRYKIRGSKQILSWILSLRMIPPIVTVVPIYLLARNLGLLDTRLVLIIMYTFMNLPLSVWLIKSFLEDIPRELEESAMVDGCSRTGAFFRITLRLAVPGIIATGMICIIFAWNEFLYANILTGAVASTAPVALTAYATPVGTLWGQIFASGTLIVLPITVIGLIFQKYLVRGLTLGALKE